MRDDADFEVDMMNWNFNEVKIMKAGTITDTLAFTGEVDFSPAACIVDFDEQQGRAAGREATNNEELKKC